MNHYETVFILTPVLSDVQMKEAVEKFKTILFLLRTDVLVFRCHHTNSPKRIGIHRAISIAKIRHGFKKLF